MILKILIPLMVIAGIALIITVINQINLLHFVHRYKVFGIDNTKEYKLRIQYFFVPFVESYKLLMPENNETMLYYRKSVLAKYFTDKINSEYPLESQVQKTDDDPLPDSPKS